MYWNDMNGSFLFNKVFSEKIKIDEIDIFDIRIDREAATVIITFDLMHDLPDNPEVKWVKGYNRCRCGVNCSGVSMLDIKGMSTDMPAKMKINKEGKYSNILIKGDSITLKLTCIHIQLMGPSVYISQ